MPVVLTVDQRSSRSSEDEVPDLLDLLGRSLTTSGTESGATGVVRGFQRTAGDEVQAVLGDAGTVVDVIGAILRSGGWSVGVGVGAVDEPLPEEARAGRGPAYLHARQAVTRAKNTPHRIAVSGDDNEGAERLETVLWLWAGILERRTRRGWEVHDALAEGRSHAEAGRLLGISQSAVSQRAHAAGLVDERRARRLAAELLSPMITR